MKMKKLDWNLKRRSFLKSSLAASAAASMGLLGREARAQAQPEDRRFLFVVAAAGGGSMIDAFLPVLEAESANAQDIVAYPTSFVQQPSGSNLRCVHTQLPLDFPFNDGFKSEFLSRHAADTAVMTMEGTSVNHLVAQKRAMNGAGANRGRTIAEAAALRHGAGMLLPNVNMAESGYLEPGDDPTVDEGARAVQVADALLFSLSTDGVRGVVGAPAAASGLPLTAEQLERGRALTGRARRVRDLLERRSVFGQTFRNAPLKKRFLDNRADLAPALEVADLITKLTIVPNVPGAIPLDDFGLEPSPDEARIRAKLPNVIQDPFEAQAALAFLLAKYNVSCSLTISPSFAPVIVGADFRNAPLAFDFSHTDHVTAQYLMWRRVLKVTDALVSLLKEEPYGDGTLWDRSVVYIATDFGRDKVRPTGAAQFGTGHNLNNGNVIMSPFLNANRVYGGVDPDTGLTFGFDLQTGDPLPTNRQPGDLAPSSMPREQHMYAAVAQALDVDYEGRIDIPCMLR
jgi:hypothetical protein